MNIWLVLASVDEGGWIVHGLFWSKRNALRYAATVPHPTYIGPRVVDAKKSWDDAGVLEPAHPVSRADLLTEGLDFTVTA